MVSGRLFKARGPATAKVPPPSVETVDLHVAGTIRSDDVTDPMLAIGETVC